MHALVVFGWLIWIVVVLFPEALGALCYDLAPNAIDELKMRPKFGLFVELMPLRPPPDSPCLPFSSFLPLTPTRALSQLHTTILQTALSSLFERRRTADCILGPPLIRIYWSALFSALVLFCSVLSWSEKAPQCNSVLYWQLDLIVLLCLLWCKGC